MTMATKQEVLQDKLAVYLAADKAGKGEVLDHLAAVTGMHRQAIIRRLNTLAGRDPAWQPERRGRKEKYGPAITMALKELWELSGMICAERLHPQIPEYVKVLKRFDEWAHPADTTALLLEMSLGTIKDRLERLTRIKRGGQAATKPSGLKELVPIRRGPWADPEPGFGEVDTVAHCGTSLRGDYAYSVQYTDVSVLWTLLAAQWNKGMQATAGSLKAMSQRCPFALQGFDFDSGGEFINEQVVSFCKSLNPPIKASRTRPYRKNDHGRIEQKQYANVRRWVGYLRYEEPGQVKILNQLYLALEDYLNFFVPSVKCIKKERVGAKYRRRYDAAQTAYRRVLSEPRISEPVKQRLQKKYATLNPKVLKTKIQRLQDRLIKSVRSARLTNKLQ